jgi:hypothetical protein
MNTGACSGYFAGLSKDGQNTCDNHLSSAAVSDISSIYDGSRGDDDEEGGL